jgi:hypothetical protein
MGPLKELLEERSMWDAGAIPRGSRPLDYLQMLADAPRALVIHGNFLDAAERAFLAEHADRMSLVYCPRTHAYFDHPPYPLAELLAAGTWRWDGQPGIESDLNLLGECRRQADASGDRSHDILRMGTLAGRAGRAGSESCAGSWRIWLRCRCRLVRGNDELLEEMLGGGWGVCRVGARLLMQLKPQAAGGS